MDFYFIVSVFNDEGARDSEFGREFYAIARGQKKAPDYMGYELLYLKKGNRPTGKIKKGMFSSKPEQLPSIEMVIGVPEESTLEGLLNSERKPLVEKKKVTSAGILFTTDYYADSVLADLKEELDSFCNGNETTSLSYRVQEAKSKGYTYHYAHGIVTGPIKPVVGIYDFLQRRGFKLTHSELTFV